MKNILVTGGAGFIGSHLVERLVKDGCNVIVIDDFSTGRDYNLKDVREKITIVKGDITDLNKLETNIDIIFHQAAKLEIFDSETIIEMSTFVAKGTSYEASDGNHDDLMMNLVLFGWFATTDMFMNLTDINIKQMLYSDRMQAIEDDMVPFGVIDDGYEDNTEVDSSGQVWEVYDTGMY